MVDAVRRFLWLLALSVASKGPRPRTQGRRSQASRAGGGTRLSRKETAGRFDVRTHNPQRDGYAGVVETAENLRRIDLCACSRRSLVPQTCSFETTLRYTCPAQCIDERCFFGPTTVVEEGRESLLAPLPVESRALFESIMLSSCNMILREHDTASEFPSAAANTRV